MELISTHPCRLWLRDKFFVSIIKGPKPFDFTKASVICLNLFKLTYKVKYIRKVNEDLIMFFRNSRI